MGADLVDVGHVVLEAIELFGRDGPYATRTRADERVDRVESRRDAVEVGVTDLVVDEVVVQLAQDPCDVTA